MKWYSIIKGSLVGKLWVAGFRNHDNNSNSTVAVPAPAVVAVALIALAVAVVCFWRKSCTLVGFHIVIFLCVKKSGTGKERYAEWGMTCKNRFRSSVDLAKVSRNCFFWTLWSFELHFWRQSCRNVSFSFYLPLWGSLAQHVLLKNSLRTKIVKFLNVSHTQRVPEASYTTRPRRPCVGVMNAGQDKRMHCSRTWEGSVSCFHPWRSSTFGELLRTTAMKMDDWWLCGC